MIEVYSDVVAGLIITKDNNGNVYMPEFGFNGIGDWTFKEGYQYKMGDPYILTVRGSRVVPELNEITLLSGWNIISYLRKDPADIALTFEDITDQLIIVKDENGNVFMPEFSFNGIGNFNQGQGYQVKTFNQVDFTFAPK